MTKNIRKRIGNNLRKAREKTRLTQVEVSEKADIHPNYYARIERGEANPSQEIFFRITRALKVKSSEILPY